MANNTDLKIVGLYTHQNPLGEVPKGSLSEADNIVINRESVAESRRGNKIYGNSMDSGSSNTAHQLLNYKNRILRHFGAGVGDTLEFDDGSGNFTAFSETIEETELGLRIKGIEVNGNFYFTTSKGIKRISVASASDLNSNSISDAGGPKALDLQAVLNTQTGFFTQDSVVAYRLVWGKKDANGNLILGFPSERVVIYNPITDLLIKDFNNLLIALDETGATNTGILTDTTYVSLLKTPINSTASVLKNNLKALVEKLDADIVITEGSIDTVSAEVASNVASIKFSADVSTYLSANEFIELSGFTGSGNTEDLNGFHKITSVSTTDITFDINHADFGTTADTGGVVKRLKYTVNPFRETVEADLADAIEGVTILNQVAYIRLSNDVSSLVKVGDVITISGLDGSVASINGERTIIGIQKTVASNDTIKVVINNTDVSPEVTSSDATSGIIVTNPSELDLTLNELPTTAQLETLQGFYDSIVNGLQLEPSGIIASVTPYDSLNSTQSATVDLTFTIPQDVTTEHFYQLYRSNLTISDGVNVLSDLDPGDELKLAYEANPTSSELSAESITIHDITPESFLGANLYTNPNTGEGITQGNERPPFAKDIALYKTFTFYANTKTRFRKQLSLLSVSNLDNGTLTISNENTTNTYYFVPPVAEVTQIVCNAASTLTPTGTGDAFLINSAEDVTEYYVWYNVDSGNNDPNISGKTGIEVEVTAGDTDSDIASKTKTALNVISDFSISVLTNTLTITNSKAGLTTDASDAGTGFAITITTQGNGEDADSNKVVISEAETPSQQVDETSRSLVRVINKNSSETVYAFYLSGPSDVPGMILLESRILDDTPFYLVTNTTLVGEQFSPSLAPSNIITAISVDNPTEVTSTNHGLSTDDKIIISGSNSSPSIDGIQTVTVINSDTFSVPVDVSTGSSVGGFIKLSNAQHAENEVFGNRLYYSKSSQPDAVPLLNYLDIGPRDKQIKRILALRDGLFVIKEEGIYRISGEIAPFITALFDNSTHIQSADSACVLNNQIYMDSDQGIANITDTGVNVISRAIEKDIIKLASKQYTNYRTASFGVAYESDRSYLFWTVKAPSDTVATQAFVYNTFTQAWTKRTQSKRCGLINSEDDKLYLGAADTNYIEQERKNYDRTDYSDREVSITIDVNKLDGDSLTLTSISNINIGDSIVQTQYLTISQFNRLLQKLDNDFGVNDSDYLSSLGVEAGASLRSSLTSLAVKLDNDIGVSDTNYATAISGFGSTFVDIQDAFNVITAKLNLDPGVVYNNYPTSTGTVDFEVVIVDIDTTFRKIFTKYPYPFIVGPATVYNRIVTKLTWNPQTFEDVSILKQVREAALIFQDTAFTSAYISFASDLSPNFEQIDFNGDGNSSFGSDVFGDTYFGGSGNGAPFRTLIPLEKSRCRYLLVKFGHSIAREQFSILGIGLVFEISSTRAYR